MSVPLLDLKRSWAEIENEVKGEWEKVFSTMKLFNGENLIAFEKEIAQYLGSTYAYGVGSGTDALTLGLIACGVGLGDEVIIHANAFVAAVEAVKHCGATPVLVDMNERDFGPDVEQVKGAITPKTKAMIVVHMYGHPVEMDPILKICREYEIILIEDASHAHGAEYKGKKVGTFGKVGAFSCGVVKNLNALGDAGFVVTDDEEIAFKLNYLRVHGQVKKNDHHFYGFNSRLDEIQAVVLRARLRRLDEKNKKRREIASLYQEALSNINDLILPPADPPYKKSVYHRYVIRTPRRDELISYLKEKGIGTGIYYPVPLHMQRAWKEEGYPEYHLPVSERVAKESLAIPLFPEMSDSEVEEVIDAVRNFFGG